MKYLSQIELAPGGKFSGPGNKGLLADPGNGIDTFAAFISSAIGLMTIIAVIWFVFSFFTGAISLITSGGDKASLESARKKIFTSVIGLVVVISAIFIINLIGYLIGLPNILDIGDMFNTLK